MKKAVSRILAVGMAAVMALSLASCANPAPAAGSGSSDASSAASQASSTASKSSGKYASMKEDAESEEVQSQIKSLEDTVKAGGMELAIVGEDNKFIYAYTFTKDMNVEGVADQLKKGLDAQAATFESVATSLKLAVDVENPVVVVKYINNDGTELYSQEFSAK